MRKTIFKAIYIAYTGKLHTFIISLNFVTFLASFICMCQKAEEFKPKSGHKWKKTGKGV